MSQTTKKESSKTSGSKLEDDLLWELMTNGFPTPYPQQELSPRITPKRKWSVDFVFHLQNFQKLHVEVQGGTWIRGRHSRGVGARSDAQKLNYASCIGHRTLYITSDMIRDKTALDWIYLALFHSKTGYGADDPYKLPGAHHRVPLMHFLERRAEFYGEPLSLEAVCKIRRKKRKKKQTVKATKKKKAVKAKK
jgi:hypothetical protein